MAECHVNILVHYNGEIVNTVEGETFISDDQAWLVVSPSISLFELQSRILEEFDGNNKQIAKIFYRMPVDIGPNGIRYRRFRIRKDEHVSHMFSYFNSFSDVRRIDLFVELQDGPFSSGGSDVGTSSFVAAHHASPSFEVSCDHAQSSQHAADDDLTSLSFAHLARQVEESLPLNPQPLALSGPIQDFHFDVEDRGIHNEEEEEFDHAGNDGGEEEDEELFHVPNLEEQFMSPPQAQSQSREHPSHYSAVDFDAMRSDLVGSASGSGFGGENELAVGQVFRNKEEVLFAVKRFSIQRGVQYKVHESDHTKFHCKCVKFGDGCNWSIRVTLRTKSRMWEVRKLNGPHTCTFPESSNQHAQMDYHIICAHIYPLVQADPTIAIKSLQASVESELRFKTTYRKVWLAKQKAIAMIYGDWEQSYNELPRWLGGLQSYMPGTFVQLQTGPYYVGDVVDQNSFMFHRLF